MSKCQNVAHKLKETQGITHNVVFLGGEFKAGGYYNVQWIVDGIAVSVTQLHIPVEDCETMTPDQYFETYATTTQSAFNIPHVDFIITEIINDIEKVQ